MNVAARRQAVLLSIAGAMLNHSVLGGTRLLVTLYAIHLGASPLKVGVLMALYSLCPMLFAVTVGRFVDRTGARQPMILSSAVLGIAALMPWFWPGMTALYASSVLIGASFMVYNVCFQHVVGYVSRAEYRVQNFRLAALAFSVSGVAGPMFAGFGIDLIGYSPMFLFLSTFPLATIALISMTSARLNPNVSNNQAAAARRFLDLVRKSKLRTILLVGALLDMAWDLFTFAMPVHGSHIGLTPSAIGLILGMFSAATFVARVLLPLTHRWLNAWPLLIVSIFATGGTYALFAVSQGVVLLAILAIVLGLSLGGVQPLVMTQLHDAAPPDRVGEAMGIRAALNGMNQTGLPLLVGGVAATTGMVPVFLATSFLFAASGLAARRYRRRL